MYYETSLKHYEKFFFSENNKFFIKHFVTFINTIFIAYFITFVKIMIKIKLLIFFEGFSLNYFKKSFKQALKKYFSKIPL